MEQGKGIKKKKIFKLPRSPQIVFQREKKIPVATRGKALRLNK